MSALFAHHASSAGVDVRVASAGMVSAGMPPTPETARMLASHGLDVRDHLSRRVDEEMVGWADLIVTAERDHVVSIAGRWPTALTSTFTLPELVARSGPLDSRGERSTQDWLAEVAIGRPLGLDYLDAVNIGEIEDPTGEPRRTWDRVFQHIDELTRRLALALQ